MQAVICKLEKAEEQSTFNHLFNGEKEQVCAQCCQIGQFVAKWTIFSKLCPWLFSKITKCKFNGFLILVLSNDGNYYDKKIYDIVP